MTERKLDEIAMSNGMWREAADEMAANNWSLREQSDHYALQIACGVLSGSFDLKNLKAEATALNDLDAQAVDIAAGDIEVLEGDDFREAMARRIGHHAARKAFKYVRTHNDRIGFKQGLDKVKKMMKSQGPGMGRLESHDISLGLVLRAAGKKVE